jgi:hypothetical protein
MLSRILMTEVKPGQRFGYAGRTFSLATDEELRRHPCRDKLAGYCHPDRGSRVPCSFNTSIQVFVEAPKNRG